MGKFEIEFSGNAAKNYKKLPTDYKALVDLTLRKLSSGEENIYRIRVGKYRILFSVMGSTLLITKIGPRGNVYK